MGGSNCKGAIFTASSHDGAETDEIIHKNIVITNNTFEGISVPAVSLNSVNGVTVSGNRYAANVPAPVATNCKKVDMK